MGISKDEISRIRTYAQRRCPDDKLVDEYMSARIRFENKEIISKKLNTGLNALFYISLGATAYDLLALGVYNNRPMLVLEKKLSELIDDLPKRNVLETMAVSDSNTSEIQYAKKLQEMHTEILAMPQYAEAKNNDSRDISSIRSDIALVGAIVIVYGINKILAKNRKKKFTSIEDRLLR